MNLFHVVLFLYGSSTMVVTEKRYPSLVMTSPRVEDYDFASMNLTQFSSHEEDRALAYGTPQSDRWYYFFCPAQPRNGWQQTLNQMSKSKNAVFYRIQRKSCTFTDQPMPTCELPVHGAIDIVEWKSEKYARYGMRIELCTILSYQDKGKVNLMEPKKNFKLTRHLLIFNFDWTTNIATYVEYGFGKKTMLMASSKTDDIPFDKNLDFLETDVDHRYNDFRNRILPRMQREKSNNPLAHRLGIQKVQLALRDDRTHGALKTITYADVITTPIWRSLLVKWNAVEIFVRKYAKTSDIFVRNGIAGTLATVNDYYKNEDDESKKLRVPEYVWKMVCDWWTCGYAVLIVMHNNPFADTKPHSCAESCAKYGWLVDNHDYRSGTIYCCKLTTEIINQLGIFLKNVPMVYDITDRGPYTKLRDVVSAPTKGSYDW